MTIWRVGDVRHEAQAIVGSIHEAIQLKRHARCERLARRRRASDAEQVANVHERAVLKRARHRLLNDRAGYGVGNETVNVRLLVISSVES